MFRDVDHLAEERRWVGAGRFEIEGQGGDLGFQ